MTGIYGNNFALNYVIVFDDRNLPIGRGLKINLQRH